jgi:desampylase
VNKNKARGAYRISAGELRRLRAQAERKQKSGQMEVCGLILSGDGNRIELVYLSNKASKPGRFLIEQLTYKSVQDRAEKLGKSVLGSFHSHPISEAIPGARDIKNAKLGSIILIYDVCGKQAKLWEIRRLNGRRQAEELTLNSIRGI